MFRFLTDLRLLRDIYTEILKKLEANVKFLRDIMGPFSYGWSQLSFNAIFDIPFSLLPRKPVGSFERRYKKTQLFSFLFKMYAIV